MKMNSNWSEIALYVLIGNMIGQISLKSMVGIIVTVSLVVLLLWYRSYERKRGWEEF